MKVKILPRAQLRAAGRSLVQSSLNIPTFLLALALIGAFTAISALAPAQAVKGSVSPDAPPPPLTFHGLVPGLDKMEKVRATLGEPEFEAKWYSYKLYYPSERGEGLLDVVHMHGNSEGAGLANIEAASVPAGYETEGKIRAVLGEPEFELAMSTWKMLDYNEQGLRFSLNADGETIGVAYFPHGKVRVPAGARKKIDLSSKRQGLQPKPRKAADLRGLRAGTSEIVFSPTGKDWLGHPYKVVSDLKARVIVFAAEGQTIALVGADLFGMGWDNVNIMRERVREFGVDHMVLAMSHCHSAGDTIGVYGHYPAEYIAHIQDRVVEAVKQATERLAPVAELKFASRELPMDGARVQGLFRNARNSGVLDPQIALIQVIGASGKTLATIVNFACHVESISGGERTISADFPGVMCDQIHADGGGQAVFLNGALGGMVSGDNRERTYESSNEMGLRLAEIVKDLAGDARSAATFEFSAMAKPIELPLTNRGFDAMVESGLRSINRGRMTSDMLYLRIGEAQLITLPGELLPEVGFEILEHMDGFPRMLIGLANDQVGYMVPPYDFRDDAYEESMSVGPATAPVVRDTAIRMLRGIR